VIELRGACERHRPALIDFVDRGDIAPGTAKALAHLDRCSRCTEDLESTLLAITALRRIGDDLARVEPSADAWPRLRARLETPVHRGTDFPLARPANEVVKRTLQPVGSFFAARRYLGQVYEEQGRYEQAIAELNQALTLSNGSAVVKVELAHAYAVAGKKDEARKIISELPNSTSAYQLAAIYAALGEKEEAFASLQKALVERSDRLIYLKVDPRLKPLRGDARFTHLLQKIGL